MEKIKFYAELFGGIFEKILEYPGDVQHENLSRSIEAIDRWIASRFKTKIDPNVQNWINSKVLDDICKDKDPFRYACRYGHLTAAKWLYGLKIFNVKPYMFTAACGNGHLSVAQWLYELGFINIHTKEDAAFRAACRNEHFHVAEWLYFLDPINIRVMTSIFNYACIYGYLSVARWIYSLGVDIHANRDHVFLQACKYGHLLVAQWLYGLGGIDVNDVNSYAFRHASRRKHLDVAQWLHGLGVNVHVGNDTAFLNACLNGDLAMIEWLFSVGGVDEIDNKLERGFNMACTGGHLKVVRWLYARLGGVVIHGFNWIINEARRNRHEELAEWLRSIQYNEGIKL
jgi:hypothetical protein